MVALIWSTPNNRTRTRRMQRQCGVDMSVCVRYCVKNRDDVGEVAFPFMILRGYKCGHETPSFVGHLEVDKYSNALMDQSSSVNWTVSIENNLS